MYPLYLSLLKIKIIHSTVICNSLLLKFKSFKSHSLPKGNFSGNESLYRSTMPMKDRILRCCTIELTCESWYNIATLYCLWNGGSDNGASSNSYM